jgi:hypothetical protein
MYAMLGGHSCWGICVGRKKAVDDDDDRHQGSISPELAALLAELEITVRPTHAYRAPMTTMAVETMESILSQYGYAHLKMVLMSIAETANNKRELVAPTIWAVSDLVRAHPHWTQRASDWFKAFDKVDLGKLLAFAKRNRDAVKPRAALATLLFGFLNSAMEG